MKIVKKSIINAMLTAIMDSIYLSGVYNHIIYMDDSNNVLAEMPFNKVEFTLKNGITALELSDTRSNKMTAAVTADGKVSKFIIKDSSNTIAIQGLVGKPGNPIVDIRFNTVDWVSGNNIDITDIHILLEEQCLRQ
jgi:hypothetical protein